MIKRVSMKPEHGNFGKESGREFSEDSLKYTEKFLKTLKFQVVPEVGNSHT